MIRSFCWDIVFKLSTRVDLLSKILPTFVIFFLRIKLRKGSALSAFTESDLEQIKEDLKFLARRDACFGLFEFCESATDHFKKAKDDGQSFLSSFLDEYATFSDRRWAQLALSALQVLNTTPRLYKLGVYAETLMRVLLEAKRPAPLLASHLQLFDSKRQTFGEIDYLLIDRGSKRVIHLEYAFKLYCLAAQSLQLGSELRLDQFVGPRKIDNLEKKRGQAFRYLFDGPVPENARIYHQAIQDSLAAAEITSDERRYPLSQHCLFQGRIFLPCRSNLEYSDLSQKVAGHLASSGSSLGLSRSTETAGYLPRRIFISSRDIPNSVLFSPCDRLHYLNGRVSPKWKTHREICNQLREEGQVFQKEDAVMLQVSGSRQRFLFLLDDRLWG